MRLIDAEPIEKYIENGLNEKDPAKRFGHDAIEIMAEIHYAPTIAQPPNNPMTMDELQEMDGNPVWVYNLYNISRKCSIVEYMTSEDVFFTDGTVRRISDYGIGWLAFLRKLDEWA